MLHHKHKTLRIPRCRYLSFVIPLCSILVLLLLICSFINVSFTSTVSAVSNNNIMDFRKSLLRPDLLNQDLTLDAISPDLELTNDDLTLLADTATTYADNSLSMSIGGAGLEDAVTLLPGQVAYRAHTVTISSTNIKNYTLTINGPVGLSTNSSTGTTITGADNKTPTNMADNSWGYAYGQGPNTTLSNSDLANMTYSSFTGTNNNITIDQANTSPNFTKNLVFAAKFSKDAEAGHYKATVNLSITATPKVITTYTLSYDANSGTNPPAAQTYTDTNEEGSHTFTISSTTPTRSNYEFQSWNTNSSGNGTNYNPSSTITLSQSTPTQTLYARWAQVYTRTLSFNANGGSGAPSSKSCSSTSTSCSVTIPSTKPTRTGYEFLGWNTSSTAASASYQPNGSITLSNNTPLYAIWAPIRTLSFDANGGSNPPSNQTCSGTTTTASCNITISSTKPTRTNYTFQSWNTQSDGSGTNYNPGSNITLSKDQALYAMWGPTVTGFGGIKKMQDMTPTICSGVSSGTSGQLYDTRDNNVYSVYKAKDSRCWMTSNLMIINKTISSTDSDMTSGSFTVPDSSKNLFTDSDQYDQKAYLSTASESDAGVTGYYNWYTATAGAGSSSVSKIDTSVDMSICPKGWTLPTGGTAATTDFKGFTLAEGINNSLAGFTKIQAAPYDFNYTGYVYNGLLRTGTTFGRWWSSTVNNVSDSYGLEVSNDTVKPGTYNLPRHYGLAVRCIARN